MMNRVVAWTADNAELQAVGQFLARVIAQDTAYISHGEIQSALSPDGKNWAPDLSQRFAGDMRQLGPNRSVAAMREDKALIGAAIVLWQTEEPDAAHGILEDIAIEPDARAAGAGQALVDFIEAEAKTRGMKWLFLESGLRNAGAHRFFERAGYEPVSKVFAKRL
jgi:GNAT superfamily N-acetyltransferase